MSAQPSSFLTLEDLRARWHVGRHVIDRMRRDGELRETWLGPRTLRFRLTDVQKAERQAGLAPNHLQPDKPKEAAQACASTARGHR